MTSFLTLLRNKNFLRIWLAQLLSLVIAHMLNFVLIGKIFEVTHSTVAVSLFFVLYYVPTVILGPFAGVFVDRWEKRKILIFSNLLQGIIVLFYLGLGTKIWPIYAIVILYSFFDEFFNPAVGASLPAVVEKKFLPLANTFFLLTTQGALVLGFSAGGLALRFLLNQNFIFLLSSSMLILAGLVAWGLDQEALEKKSGKKLSLARVQKELISGYRFIKNEPRVFFPILLLTALQVFVAMTVILLPSVAQQILAISFANIAFILVIPFVIGVALTGLAVRRLNQYYRKKNLITFGLLGTGSLIIFFDLVIPVVSFPSTLASTLALLLGGSAALAFIPSQTLVQEHTPFGVRGRVFSALSCLVNLAAAIPMLFTASMVDFFGVKVVLLGIGLLIVSLGLYARRGKYGLLGINHWS